MAKKKKSSEDDWFEDYDEDPKPKKKKGRRKKKKTGKVIAWIIAFIVILAILLVIRFKYAAPGDEEVVDELPPPDEIEERYIPEPEDEYDEAGVYQAPKEAPGPDVVPKEDLPKVQEVIDTTVEPELFSNIECNYDYDAELLYISLRIYNILDEDIKISPRGVQKGYNTYFLIRGVVDTDPGCSTELLPAGEWTECKRIGFDLARYANIPGINRISVQVPGKTEALLVECPALPDMADEEEE